MAYIPGHTFSEHMHPSVTRTVVSAAAPASFISVAEDIRTVFVIRHFEQGLTTPASSIVAASPDSRSPILTLPVQQSHVLPPLVEYIGRPNSIGS